MWELSLALTQFEEMNSELEENRELAENRLSELQKLQQDLQTVVQENSNMTVYTNTLAKRMFSWNTTFFFIYGSLKRQLRVIWVFIIILHSDNNMPNTIQFI